MQASDAHLGLIRAPYVLYGVNLLYGPVSVEPVLYDAWLVLNFSLDGYYFNMFRNKNKKAFGALFAKKTNKEKKTMGKMSGTKKPLACSNSLN